MKKKIVVTGMPPTVEELQGQISELSKIIKNGQNKQQPRKPKDRQSGPDITDELHYYADREMWPELKKRYYEGKCRHNAYVGTDVLITKAVLSGDLQLVLDMIADGADIDQTGSCQLQHGAGTLGGNSGRILIKLRGRNTKERQALKSLHNIVPGMAPLAKTKPSNVALWDYFINPQGPGYKPEPEK